MPSLHQHLHAPRRRNLQPPILVALHHHRQSVFARCEGADIRNAVFVAFAADGEEGAVGACDDDVCAEGRAAFCVEHADSQVVGFCELECELRRTRVAELNELRALRVAACPCDEAIASDRRGEEAEAAVRIGDHFAGVPLGWRVFRRERHAHALQRLARCGVDHGAFDGLLAQFDVDGLVAADLAHELDVAGGERLGVREDLERPRNRQPDFVRAVRAR